MAKGGIQISNLFLPILAIVILIFAAWVLSHLLDQKPQQSTRPPQPTTPQSIQAPYYPLPYKLKINFLTPTEHRFFQVLLSTIENKAYICPKVGLKDFLYINKYTKNYMKHWAKISQKHVDFLICHPETMKPLFAIELDDPSHETQKVRERDAFVERAYKDANFILIRIKTSNNYNMQGINNTLETLLKEGRQ